MSISDEPRPLVLLSGGMDSSVLLAQSLRSASRVEAVTFDYGQRHAIEIDAAIRMADHYGVRHHIVEMTALGRHLPSALTADLDVPNGPYDPESLAATVVPNRNAILLMVAAGIASVRGLGVVLTAVHAGDHDVYPDCRPESIDAIDRAAYLACGVRIEAPFADLSKQAIATLGRTYGVPLDLTYSCYRGGVEHCQTCATCIERQEALAS